MNASKEYGEAARTWEGSFIFEVKDDRDKVKKDIRGYIDLWHGKCREVRSDSEGDKADFTYSYTVDNWSKLLAKKIGPIKGIMSRKFKLDGSLKILLRYVKAAQVLVGTATEVPNVCRANKQMVCLPEGFCCAMYLIA